MDIALVIVALLALAACGAAAWLLAQRAGAAGREAAHLARASVAEADVGRLRAEVESLRLKAAAELEAERARGSLALETLRNRMTDAADALDNRLRDRDELVKELEVEVARLNKDLEAAQAFHQKDLAREQAVLSSKIQAVEQQEKTLQQKVRETFAALSNDALKSASTEFLRLAEERFKAQQQASTAELDKKKLEVDALLKPIAATLHQTDIKLQAMGTTLAGDRASMIEQVRAVAAAGETLRLETQRLTKALSKPEVRGRYGELQLRRVAELAGMVAYCDFAEQTSQRNEDGRLLRPDMVVRLPNERLIVVDAKCNTLAYLEAIDAPTEEARAECLERFARHVAEQVTLLGKKNYWANLEGSPDFVVMFIPGDQFLDAALARRGDLLEQAIQQGVIIASPSTLIGLLRAVAIGWQESRVAEQAQELMELGRQLHERAAVAFEHIARVGEGLEKVVKSYNSFVSSYESRMEPTLRKFEEMNVKSPKELADVSSIELRPRTLPLPHLDGQLIDGQLSSAQQGL